MDNMDNIKGIIFSLEALFKSSKKKLLSDQIVVDPKQLYVLLDKLKDAIEDYEAKQKQYSNHYTRIKHAQGFSAFDQKSQYDLVLKKYILRVRIRDL